MTREDLRLGDAIEIKAPPEPDGSLEWTVSRLFFVDAVRHWGVECHAYLTADELALYRMHIHTNQPMDGRGRFIMTLRAPWPWIRNRGLEYFDRVPSRKE
jgi:hypothetical protein